MIKIENEHYSTIILAKKLKEKESYRIVAEELQERYKTEKIKGDINIYVDLDKIVSYHYTANKSVGKVTFNANRIQSDLFNLGIKSPDNIDMLIEYLHKSFRKKLFDAMSNIIISNTKNNFSNYFSKELTPIEGLTDEYKIKVFNCYFSEGIIEESFSKEDISLFKQAFFNKEVEFKNIVNLLKDDEIIEYLEKQYNDGLLKKQILDNISISDYFRIILNVKNNVSQYLLDYLFDFLNKMYSIIDKSYFIDNDDNITKLVEDNFKVSTSRSDFISVLKEVYINCDNLLLSIIYKHNLSLPNKVKIIAKFDINSLEFERGTSIVDLNFSSKEVILDVFKLKDLNYLNREENIDELIVSQYSITKKSKEVLDSIVKMHSISTALTSTQNENQTLSKFKQVSLFNTVDDSEKIEEAIYKLKYLNKLETWGALERKSFVFCFE